MPERPSKPTPALTPPPPTFNSISQRQKEAAAKKQLSRSAEKLGRESPSELAERIKNGENGAMGEAVAEGAGGAGGGDGKGAAGGGDVQKPNGQCCTSSELLPGEAGDHRTSSPAWESISLPGSEGEPEKSEKKEKASERAPLSNGWSGDLEDKSEGDLIDMLLDTVRNMSINDLRILGSGSFLSYQTEKLLFLYLLYLHLYTVFFTQLKVHFVSFIHFKQYFTLIMEKCNLQGRDVYTL
jgi:hypothetical protein